MPLVAYDTSDDEDSQGDAKTDSLGKAFGKNSDQVNQSTFPNQLSGPSNGSSGTLVDPDDVGGHVEDIDDVGSALVHENHLEDDGLGPSSDSSGKLLEKLSSVGKKLPVTSALSTGLSDIVVIDKKSKRIKVVIPSLDELDYASEEEEEEEVGPKRKIIPAGGCSLSSFLPKPKNAPSRFHSTDLFSSPSSSSSNSSVKTSLTSLVPHSVSRPKKNLPPPPKRPQSVLVQSDEGDSQLTDFFSFGSVSQPKRSKEDLETRINDIRPVIKPKPETESPFNEMMLPKAQNEDYTSNPVYSQPYSGQSTSSKKYNPSGADINDPDYKKYIASKFGEEPADQINIVEVDVESYLASDTSLIQSISMETAPSSIKGPAPSALAKRKNQITYLAYQAQQRELDLKNQAANNRFTKAQTRAKYGF